MKIKVGGWDVNLKSLISLRINKYYIPFLNVHEKLEKPLRITIWSLTVIGILSSLIAFDQWYWSLIFSISLTLFSLLFDKSIVQYSTIIVTPLPEFDIHSNEWNGMTYILPNYPDDLPLIGPTFKSKAFALKFYELLKNWNYGSIDDKQDNNIRVSIVIENPKDYAFYLYPDPKRKSIIDFFETSKRGQAFEKQGKSQQELITMVIFCRIFPYGVNSGVLRFAKQYKWGAPFGLTVFLRNEETNEISFIEEAKPINKLHLRYMERKFVPDTSIENLHKPKINR